MNTSIRNVILGFGFALISVIPASANTLVFSITAAQIYSGATNTTTGVSSTIGNNCGGSAAVGGGASGLPFCGIYAVGFTTAGVSGAAVTLGGTPTAVAGALWGVTSTDNWIQQTLPSGGIGVEANDYQNGTIAYVASQTTGAGTIANGLSVASGTAAYTSDAAPATNLLKAALTSTSGDGVGSDVGILSASTVFTFYVTFPTTITTTTTANLNLEVLLARINPTTGAQQAKSYDGTFTLTGVSGTAVPEPSSILLMFGALSAVAAKYRRRS